MVIAIGSGGVYYNVAYYETRDGRNTSCVTLAGLTLGRYNYSVFTINERGTPITKSADVTYTIDVLSDSMTESIN